MAGHELLYRRQLRHSVVLCISGASGAATVNPMPERWRQPFASSDAIQRRMSTQRSQDTAPELALRRRIHSMGLRYRIHRFPVPTLRRKADIVFGPARVAVFVDGCFWHGCPEHGHRKHQVNGWYWPEKIERNRRRDADTDRLLAAAGWLVLRIWEHEDFDLAAERVADAVGRQRLPTGGPGDQASPRSTRSS